jgi:hypothetical protein
MTTVTERMQKGRGKKKVGGAATSSNSCRGLPKAKFASLSYLTAVFSALVTLEDLLLRVNS